MDMDKLTESQRMVILQTRVLENDSRLEEHHKILVEGKSSELPLLERVRNLEAFATSIKFWLRTIAVAIVLQTITFGVAAVVYFVRLYPLLEKLTDLP